MTNGSTYPVSLASPRNDSAMSATTSAVGQVTWSKAFGLPAGSGQAPTLLLWGERVVVVSATELAVFDRDGERRSTHAVQQGTPAAIGQNRLYFKGRHRFLDAVDPAGARVLAEAPFPGAMDEDIRVLLFWPRDEDFVAVLYTPPDMEVADGDSPDKPSQAAQSTVMVNRYETTYGDFLHVFDGRPSLPPLLSPERHVVALAIGDRVHRIDVAEQVELASFTLTVERKINWSVDREEVYCTVGYVKGRKVAVAQSADGQPVWQWTDAVGDDAWAAMQPPVRAAGGRTYVLTEGRLIALDRGLPAWEFDARSDALRHGARVEEGSFEIKDGRLLAKGRLRHATALADGSVVVTGGRMVHHIAADGRKRFSVQVGQDVLSPPVVDGEGHIFVATATELLRID